MTDSVKFRDFVRNKGIKLNSIAKLLNITPYCLQMKIDNISEFKVSEVMAIAAAYGMTQAEKESIFFAGDVELNSTQ